MFNFFSRLIDIPDLKKLDIYLIGLILIVSLFGLVSVATASIYFSDNLTGDPFYLFYKQAFHFLLAILLSSILICIPLSYWERFDRYLLLLGLVGLILVFIPGIGVEVKGSNRWIRIFGFTLQPSEVMKFFLLIYVSAYSVRRIKDIQASWFGFFRPAVLIVLVISLIT